MLDNQTTLHDRVRDRIARVTEALDWVEDDLSDIGHLGEQGWG